MPWLSQVCTALPEHRFAPGVQTPGMQVMVVVEQKFPDAHWVLSVHMVRQAVVDAHVNPPGHGFDVPGEHMLMPSHEPAGVRIEAPAPLTAHEAVPQVVPMVRTRHALLPLQAPSRPQALAASTAHSLSTSMPAGTGAQRPFV